MHLLSLVADRLWLVKGGAVAPYGGDLEQYRAELLAGDPAEKPASKPKDKPARPSRDAVLALRSEARKCEERVNKLAEMLEKLDEKLADPALYDASRAAERDKWLLKHAEARDAMTRAEELWMAALEALETAVAG